MIHHLYAIRDMEAGQYLGIMQTPDIIVAKRSIVQALENPQLAFSRFQDSFCLYRIGSYDDIKGQVTSLENGPECVGSIPQIRDELSRGRGGV